MRLYTKTSPTNTGLLSKKVAWNFDYRLQLTEEEAALVQAYQCGNLTVGTCTVDKDTLYVSVNQAVAGKKGCCFEHLGSALQLEASLIDGCKNLGGTIEELRRIRAGGERIYDITADAAQLIDLNAQPKAARPPAMPATPPPLTQAEPQAS